MFVAKLTLIPPPREKWRALKLQSRQTGTDFVQKYLALLFRQFLQGVLKILWISTAISIVLTLYL